MVRKKVKKSRVKKVPGEKRSASAAYNDFVVVLENVYSEINVVGESLDLFREQANARFDKLEIRLGRVEDTTSSLKINVEELDNKADDLGASLKELTRRVDLIDEKVDQLNKDMEFVKVEIRMIRHDISQKVNREEFQMLAERVEKLEKELSVR